MKEAKRPHILLLEKDSHSLNTLDYILTASSYKVSSARSCKSALDKIAAAIDDNCPVDLLLLDTERSDTPAIELIDRLRQQEIDISLFVITAHGNKEFIIELLRKGCDEYLEHPFKAEELVGRIERLLQKKMIRAAAKNRPDCHQLTAKTVSAKNR